jgi:hypothetical protein
VTEDSEPRELSLERGQLSVVPAVGGYTFPNRLKRQVDGCRPHQKRYQQRFIGDGFRQAQTAADSQHRSICSAGFQFSQGAQPVDPHQIAQDAEVREEHCEAVFVSDWEPAARPLQAGLDFLEQWIVPGQCRSQIIIGEADAPGRQVLGSSFPPATLGASPTQASRTASQW